MVRALPSGRHGLSREQVVASQRERMLAALVSAVAENGYPGTTVADVLGRAGVSRQTFYEQFDNKEDCFLKAFQARVDELAGVMRAATEGTGLPAFDHMLAAYLNFLAAEPAYSRTFLIEIYAAGPDALTARLVVHQRFVDMLTALFDPGGHSPRMRLRAEALTGAISSMVTTRIAAGAYADLPTLHKPLLDMAIRIFGT